LKKAYGNKKIILLFFLSACFIFLTSACGLDVISVVLEDNVNVSHSPTIESNYDNCNFDFSISRLSDSNSMGRTYVYYKIYNSSDKLNSEVGELNNLAGDSTKKYTSWQRMINTYNYCPLMVKNEDSSKTKINAFELENGSYEVKIRLTNYDESFCAGVWVDSDKKGIPVRFENEYTFDFGRNGSYDKKPEKTPANNGDTKNFVDEQKEEEKDIYYVALYSVFMMLDDEFNSVYSPIHHLGNVKIDSNSERN